jgi:hypothetical protein
VPAFLRRQPSSRFAIRGFRMLYPRAEPGHLYSRADRARQHACECAEMARSTMDPHLQRSFLELEKRWLGHAEKVEERPLWWRIVARVSGFGPKLTKTSAPERATWDPKRT